MDEIKSIRVLKEDDLTDFKIPSTKINNFSRKVFRTINSELNEICDWTSSIISVDENNLLIQEENNFKVIDKSGNEITDKDVFKEIIEKAFVFTDNLAVFSIYDTDYYAKAKYCFE